MISSLFSGFNRIIPAFDIFISTIDRLMPASIHVTEVLPLPTKYKFNNDNTFLFHILLLAISLEIDNLVLIKSSINSQSINFLSPFPAYFNVTSYHAVGCLQSCVNGMEIYFLNGSYANTAGWIYYQIVSPKFSYSKSAHKKCVGSRGNSRIINGDIF